MEQLPKELLILIFSHLDSHSLFHASRVCTLWHSTIFDSHPIASRFSYKVYTGPNIMPDAMSYYKLRDFKFECAKNDVEIKFGRFWPNLRTTEVGDIVDERGEKFNELMIIISQYARVWKKVNLHDMKLEKTESFRRILETFVNCKKLSITRCSVSDAYCDEGDACGSELERVEYLGVHYNDWNVLKALRAIRNLTILRVFSKTQPPNDDLREILIANENLKQLDLYGSPKFAILSPLPSAVVPFKFQLVKLVLDRYLPAHEQLNEEFGKLSDFWPFLVSQKASLRKLKFKGIVSEEIISQIAEELSLTALNLDFTDDNEGTGGGEKVARKVTALVKNTKLEKLHVTGSASELLLLLKHFPAATSLKLNGASFARSPEMIPNIAMSLPSLTRLKIFQPVIIPEYLDARFVQFSNLRSLRICVVSAAEAAKVLELCPRLTNLTLLTDLGGDFDLHSQITNNTIEDLKLIVNNFHNNIGVVNGILWLLQALPALRTVSITSQLLGRISLPFVHLPSLERVKMDFTCTADQCTNMFEVAKRCSNVRSLEVISNFIGRFECEDDFRFDRLETLSVLGIDVNFSAFENLMAMVRVAPHLSKLEFWVRGNGSREYHYGNEQKLREMVTFESHSMRELKLQRFHWSELEMVLYLLRCCSNLRVLSIAINEESDMRDFHLEKVLSVCGEVEEFSLDKNFEWTATSLTVVRAKLWNLKKLEMYAQRPLALRRMLREVFGDDDCGVEFVINPKSLEEWTNDDIVKV